MIRRLLSAAVVVALSAGVAHAGSFLVSVNDNSAQMAFTQKIIDDEWGQSVIGVRGIYNDHKDTELVSAGLEVLAPLAQTGFELGAGVRGYYAGHSDYDLAGGGLGALVRFVPPKFVKLRLTGSIYYCPKILTGLDGERLLETEVAAAYSFAPRAAVFISHTKIRADIEQQHDSRTLDDSLRGGLSLSF